MKYDYNKVKLTAERLVKRFGREIVLVQDTEVKKDESRPWKGPSVEPLDEPFRLPVPAVQLVPNQVRIFGLSALGESGTLDNLMQTSEYVYIVFQGEVDIRRFNFLTDGGIDYQIQATQALKPADVTLLGFIGTRR